MSKRDRSGARSRLEQQEREVVRAVSHDLFHWGVVTAQVAAADLLVSNFRQLQAHLSTAMDDAEKTFAKLASLGAQKTTNWQVRVARERRDHVRELLLEANTQLESSLQRQQAAHAARAEYQARKVTGAALMEAQLEGLKNRVQEFVAEMLLELKDDASEPREPSKDELREIRKRIREEDWNDLPSYFGSDGRRGRECHNCGEPLDAERRRFCSVRCQRTYAEVFGSTTRPKMSERDRA